MNDTPVTPARRKMSPAMRVLFVAGGIAAMTGGILQIKKGLGELKGSPEVERLTGESDTALEGGNKYTLEASPILKSVLEAVDRDGLAAVRAGRAKELQQARDLFGKAATGFESAALKLEEATKDAGVGKIKPVLEAKARSYRDFSTTRTINQEICATVLDGSLKTIGEVTPKILEAANRRDRLEAKGNEAAAEAQRIMDDLKK